MKDLIYEYFGSQCNEDGKKCSIYCPHGDGICPGGENCILRTYVDQRHLTIYPEVLLIQLMIFDHNFLKDCVEKIETKVFPSETMMIDNSEYQIIGVLKHLGTYNNGHYLSLIKYGYNWYLFGDFNVPKQIDFHDISDGANFYVCVYKKNI